ncbi:MAG: PQQ-dependent sugar dehydrogenase, partial [Rubrobacter sp.]
MRAKTIGRMWTVVAFAILAGLVALLSFVNPAQTLPGDFSDTKFAGSPLPTALDFTPDGRMLVTSKTGELYTYGKDGTRLANPALNLSVCANSERGLLGVAVDPDFETNNYIYLYYTNKRAECPDKEPFKDSNPYNRVSRFTMNDDHTVDKTSEKVLVDGIPSPNGNHNAGDLHFGKDGKLYVSVGDGACDFFERSKCQYENDVARDNHILLAKILRINPDGTIPEDNPYAGKPNSARCSTTAQDRFEVARTEEGNFCEETFVKGFRNPFRFAVDYDAPGTRLFINDVGGQRWEEVDEARFGADGGDDYGWNICEGRHDNVYRGGRANCDGATYTGPVHEYNHSTGCESITASTFVPDGSNWPARYRDDYLYSDFVCGKVFALSKKSDGSGYARETFAGGLGMRRPTA